MPWNDPADHRLDMNNPNRTGGTRRAAAGTTR